jgi:hypothetical protein
MTNRVRESEVTRICESQRVERDRNHAPEVLRLREGSDLETRYPEHVGREQGAPQRGSNEKEPSHGWLGLALGAGASVALSVYVVRAFEYPPSENLFPLLIGIPTLGLAVLYLATEALHGCVAIKTRRRCPAAPTPSGRGKSLAIGLAVVIGYPVLLSLLGFDVASVLTVVGIPLVLGEPLRRAPYLLLAALLLVGVVSVVMKLSGVGVLPGGAFGVALP